MDKKKLYTGFSKICDTLNKVNIKKFICSNGVFLALENGILTIITFTEKLEKDVLYLFAYKFEFDPYLIVFMNKYFEFADLNIYDDKIEFIYNAIDTGKASKDKDAEKLFKHIKKDGKKYSISIDFFKENTKYNSILKSLNNINGNIDFEKSKEFTIDVYTEINKSETPIIIEEGEFYVRISKSSFYHIVKGDKANIKFVPYKNDSILFLVITTINKSEFQIINLFNAMYLTERDE